MRTENTDSVRIVTPILSGLYLFSNRAGEHAEAEEHFHLDMAFVSLLPGTYICTLSQDSLNSSASVTINVIPLPLKQNILIDPVRTPIMCGTPQALTCCISANSMGDYDVKFVVQEKEFQAGKKE